MVALKDLDAEVKINSAWETIRENIKVSDKESLRYYELRKHKLWFDKKYPWLESASELYRPSDRRLSAKLVPTFADSGYHVVSVTDSYGRILGFLDRSRYFFFQVAPQLYSRG
jgi:CBS-domain-containing membrane protein